VLFAAGAAGFCAITRRDWPAIAYSTLLLILFCFATAPIMHDPPAGPIHCLRRALRGQDRLRKLWRGQRRHVLGPKYGLPVAINGHQNYFYWGWNGYNGESMLTLGNDAADYTDTYAEVVDLGPFDAPWIMDHEHHHYFWLRHRKRSYASDWPEFKYWY